MSAIPRHEDLCQAMYSDKPCDCPLRWISAALALHQPCHRGDVDTCRHPRHQHLGDRAYCSHCTRVLHGKIVAHVLYPCPTALALGVTE
jgi:hypothetical protein